MLAGVTDKSAIGVRSWSSLNRRGVELRLRAGHQQQKREDGRIRAAKGHDGQAFGKKGAASISSTFVLSGCLVCFRHTISPEKPRALRPHIKLNSPRVGFLHTIPRKSIHTEISPLRFASVEMTKGRVVYGPEQMSGEGKPQVSLLRFASAKTTKGRVVMGRGKGTRVDL